MLTTSKIYVVDVLFLFSYFATGDHIFTMNLRIAILKSQRLDDTHERSFFTTRITKVFDEKLLLR